MCLYSLQELPEKWNNVKKQSAVMKQEVAPLQAEEVNRIRRDLISFDVKQHEFREEFRKIAPFNYKSTHPYTRIDQVGLKMNACVSVINLRFELSWYT